LLVTSSGGQAGVVVASRWPDADGVVVHAPPEEPVPWPASVTFTADARSALRLGTMAMPARVEVRMFSAVDNHSGVPTDAGTTHECQTLVQQGGACTSARDGSTVLVLLPHELAPYLVVYVEWYVPVEMRTPTQEDVDTRSVSYGFHLAMQSHCSSERLAQLAATESLLDPPDPFTSNPRKEGPC